MPSSTPCQPGSTLDCNLLGMQMQGVDSPVVCLGRRWAFFWTRPIGVGGPHLRYCRGPGHDSSFRTCRHFDTSVNLFFQSSLALELSLPVCAHVLFIVVFILSTFYCSVFFSCLDCSCVLFLQFLLQSLTVFFFNVQIFDVCSTGGLIAILIAATSILDQVRSWRSAASKQSPSIPVVVGGKY